METKLKFNSQSFTLYRYPETKETSLRAWNSSDLLLLEYVKNNPSEEIHLFNDRFGVFNCLLHSKNQTTIWSYASQKKAICKNLEENNLSINTNFKTPLDDLGKVTLALIKIPKSLELFELFLIQIHKASNEGTEVVCCFMTKYFSPAYLKIASKYFDEILQTKAIKKARLLILKKVKEEVVYPPLIKKIQFKSSVLEQYYGVFSSNKVDIGTQFLLENLKLKPNEKNILDLASGNGIIAHELTQQNPDISITLVDDFNLATFSSEINLKHYNANCICDNNLDLLQNNQFDLVVSNPPFHFEYENNIEISLFLFCQVKSVLQPQGRFVLVANKHLNYKTHLLRIFTNVENITENKKFVIYQCKN